MYIYCYFKKWVRISTLPGGTKEPFPGACSPASARALRAGPGGISGLFSVPRGGKPSAAPARGHDGRPPPLLLRVSGRAFGYSEMEINEPPLKGY